MSAPTPTPVTMHCLEVWGGNQATDSGVVMPGLDAWVYSRPFEGDDAGGDIHYVSSCATGRITRVLVADVSGHGRKVATVAASLRNLMRRYVNYIDQSRLVEGLNVEFGGLAETGSFATAVVASYFAPTDQFVVSNAGHPRPFRYNARARDWEMLRDSAGREGLSDIPLGVAEPTRYSQSAFRLARGDLVLIYTDSLIEAAGSDGRQLGEEGLLKILRTLEVSAPERLIPALLAAVEAFAGGPPRDDATVLLLRANDLKPRINPLRGFKTIALMTGAFFASLRPGGPPFPWPQMRFDNLFGAFWRRASAGRATHGDKTTAP